MLQLLQMGAIDSQQRDFVQTALKASGRLTSLLSDILDLSRIEVGKMELREEPFELADVLQAMEDLLGQSARQKGLQLEFFVHPDVPAELQGDSHRLQQVLLNVLGNAVKFTETGSVGLEVYPLPAEHEGQAKLLIAVHDSGVGIPVELQEDVFQSFTQADGSFRRRFGGAGLGLAIVRRLADIMQGEVELASNLDIGTEVWICLPFRAPQAPAQQEAEPEVCIVGSGYRLLVVEDDAVNRLALKKMLEKRGFAVDTADNGQEALQQLRSQGYHAVLMDIQMPVMDGVEATRHMRTDPDYSLNKATPVVAITAYAMVGDRERFLNAGMDAYIAKPVELEALLKVIQQVLA